MCSYYIIPMFVLKSHNFTKVILHKIDWQDRSIFSFIADIKQPSTTKALRVPDRHNHHNLAFTTSMW